MKKYSSYIPYFVFGIFFCYLLLQFSKVYIYYDDFGYLSLSYGYKVPNLFGHDFNLNQLLEFMKAHYFEANGRILYTGLYVFLFMIGGLRLVQISMAVIACLPFILIYRLLVRSNQFTTTQRTVLSIILCLLYGTIGIEIQRHGSYWYAAAFTYLFPCTPLLLLAELYDKTLREAPGKGRMAALCLLAFVSSFSQEQWFVATCTCTFGMIVIKCLGKHKIQHYDVLICLSGVCGGLPILFSPAVAVRLTSEGNMAYYEMGLADKVSSSVKNILTLFSTAVNQPYLSVLIVVLFLMTCYMIMKKMGNQYVHYLYLLFSAALLLFPSISQNHRFVIWSIYLAYSFAEICVFYLALNKILSLLLFVCALSSVACMAIVPEIPSRVILPFLFLSFLLIGEVTGCYLKENYLPITLCMLLFVGSNSVNNMLTIYQGYRINYKILMENQQKIERAVEAHETGNPVSVVLLQKQNDLRFGGEMMYEENFKYTEKWFRQYFNVPDSLTIQYEE